MELIIIIISIISIIILNILMSSNIKKMKEIATNEKLNKLTEKYPSNIEICKELLQKVDNKNVKIEENANSETTLYIAISNKILIGNMHNSFTRIQTIAHECLHSVQDRKLLIFNFVFSNIYFLYYIICCILIILNLPSTGLMQLIPNLTSSAGTPRLRQIAIDAKAFCTLYSPTSSVFISIFSPK